VHSRNVFSEEYSSLRQMMVHPEASKKLREQINGRDTSGNAAQQKNKRVGRFATVSGFALSSLRTAKERLKELEQKDIPNAQRDIEVARSSRNLAMKIRQLRGGPLQANPFARNTASDTPPQCLEVKEAEAIHEFYCRCPCYDPSGGSCTADSKARFETITVGNSTYSTIEGYKATENIINYFKYEVQPGRKIPVVRGSEQMDDYLDILIRRKETGETRYTNKKEALEAEKADLETRIEALEETVKSGGGNNTKNMSEDEELAARNGSKCAALIKYLWEVEDRGESTIVFSYWHDTLALVYKSLTQNAGLEVAHCTSKWGKAMSNTIAKFTSGEKKILLLSAQAKASGANLQCATNVVLLDPAGSSAEHGATLEQQAIGRAVRMGQKNAVKVIRFCVQDTIEEELFEEIDLAAAKLVTRSNDDTYMCENAHKSLDKKVLQKKKAKVDDEVFVGESVSAKERVARTMAEARAKNQIIVIDDSDDEGGDGKPKVDDSADVSMEDATAPTAPVKVKPELKSKGVASSKRGNAEVETAVDAGPDKRARVSTKNQSSATASSSKLCKRWKCDVDGCTKTFDTFALASAHERNCKKQKRQREMAKNKAKPAVEPMSVDPSDSNTEPRQANTGTYLVEPGSKIHDPEIERQQEAKDREEYAKAMEKDVAELNGHDMKWLIMFRELKKVKEDTGLAWVPGHKCPLSKWCTRQREEGSKLFRKKKTSMKKGRVQLLKNIGFPWSKTEENEMRTALPTVEEDAVGNISSPSTTKGMPTEVSPIANAVEEPIPTPSPLSNNEAEISQQNEDTSGEAQKTPPKVSQPSADEDDVGRVVSPPAAGLAEESPADEDGLKNLLEKCELGHHYLEKFQYAGISSPSQLQSKLQDLSFMEDLVRKAGLTASEAIRLQILASKQ